MRHILSATLAIACALSACPAIAGAWTQEKGKGLVITQATYFSTNEYFDVDGARVKQNRFHKWEWQPYAEYGATDWLTLGGTAYFHRVLQSGQQNNGIGDPELFARLRLWNEDSSVLSIQPMVKLASSYTHDVLPRGGSRSTDFELSLLYGESFRLISSHDYLDTRIGYRWRGRGLAPQWRSDVAYGTHLTDSLQLVLAGRGIIAAEIDENTLFREDGEQDFDLMKGEATLFYHFEPGRWVHATAYEHLAGFMAGAGRGFTFGYAESF